MREDRRSQVAVLVVILAANLLVVTFQTRVGRILPLPDAIASVFSGAQSAFASLHRAGAGLAGSLRDSNQVRRERDALRDRIARLEWELTVQRGLVHRARGFTLLDAEAFDLGEPVPAEVVGRAASPLAPVASVNRGLRHGVGKGAPVLTANGLAGRVLSVTGGTSQVELLSGGTMAVAAITAEGRIHGLVQGVRDPETMRILLHMDYVSVGQRVRIGEEVISSGLDGLYPKGLMLGRIIRVSEGSGMLLDIFLEPAADLELLERVFLLPPVAGVAEEP